MAQTDNGAQSNLSSNYNNLIQAVTGSVSMTGLGVMNQETITHNLGYIPVVDVFVKMPSGKVIKAMQAISSRAPGSLLWVDGEYIYQTEQEGQAFDISVSSTELIINQTDGSTPRTVYYVIYQTIGYSP